MLWTPMNSQSLETTGLLPNDVGWSLGSHPLYNTSSSLVILGPSPLHNLIQAGLCYMTVRNLWQVETLPLVPMVQQIWQEVPSGSNPELKTHTGPGQPLCEVSITCEDDFLCLCENERWRIGSWGSSGQRIASRHTVKYSEGSNGHREKGCQVQVLPRKILTGCDHSCGVPIFS